nr:cytochrome C [Desulfobulbaceae bacterium]
MYIYALIFLLSLTALIPPVASGSTVADQTVINIPTKPAVPSSQLLHDDCKKCHPHIVSLNLRNGAAHSTKISCIDCHDGHPPMNREIIPRCSKCHTDSPHFDLTNCSQCHVNPHTPLDIRLTRDITFQCTTCHTDQIEQLQKNPSIHTTLDCTACHIRHGYIPECFACHASHLDTMTNEDCLSCHQAHMPLIVNYENNTSSEFCGSCHTEVYQQLAESRAKHRQVPCAECHEKEHKRVPTCRKCHPQPHPEAMLKGFPTCGTCHGIAHSLKLNKIDLSIKQQRRP